MGSFASTSRVFSGEPSVVIVAPASPSGPSAVRAWATVRVEVGTIQALPPVNSMSRLSPRVPSEMIPAAMTTDDRVNHHRRRRTKSNFVSPW